MSEEVAILGAGCFWCTEAAFQQIKGVKEVVPGYAGGHVEKPTYQQVCRGNTGHAEVGKITFDPEEVSYAEILEIFFSIHDPTSLNRQGADAGEQYRSVIFYMSPEQEKTAREMIKKMEEEHVYGKPIVTSVEAFTNFFEAEDYHKNYYKNNSREPYCQLVISPKLKKLQKNHPESLKL
ncbi:peptide-methionine (S)-S-oxide reductase MsrA [Cuniculiplasma divulgatum]|uniref:Peptide methionine sulfoxide reductase MsrA n=1 Tax=Cuniculiplasma divulgatum TaxID=1673428 RepID=A0A1N5V4U1_9ARCH|nr:peptide-methionine (S)-S-oxide reductase MsrA [Cuniculiplasma divulgatum]SIM68021.1 peptide methionine sulfoxide reductase [Cuniculiplasma divulgatum]